MNCCGRLARYNCAILGNMDAQFARTIIESVSDGYNTIAQHFSDTRQEPWPEFAQLERAIRQLPSEPQRPVHMLDVGCGNGRLAEDVAPSGVEYTGIDISTELIGLAKQQRPQFSFTVADMTDLPFRDHSFEVITAIASLQHVPSRDLRVATLQEMARVATSSGLLFMTNWNLYQPHMPDYLAMAQQAYGQQWEAGDAVVPWNNAQGEEQSLRYYHAYTQDSLTTELQAAGWHTIRHTYWARGQRSNSTDGFNIVTTAHAPK